jgi:hypothetical protein
MAEGLKVPKNLELYINIVYQYNNNIIKQILNFYMSNKRYLRYIYDMRYCLKSKVDKVLEEVNLNSQDIQYMSRIDEKSFIEVNYKILGKEKYDFKPVIKCISFYLPPSSSCQYCKKKRMENDMIYCEEKKKWYNKTGCKTCKIFSSIDEIIT